jgi:hypothetical protein
MIESTDKRYLVAQPLTPYVWPYATPAKLWHGLWVKPTPKLPAEEDQSWRWSLSGSESASLTKYPWWVTLEFHSSNTALGRRQQRAVELVKYARLGIQLVAPVGSSDSTIVVTSPGNSTVVFRQPPMTSTPWGRICGYENSSLAEIRKVVRGVSSIFRFRVPRLINPLQFLELGFGQDNPYIRIFLWVSGLDSILMAGDSKNFKKRLVNVFGDSTFVLPNYLDSQPRYRVGEIAEELYDLRSKIAHGNLIPAKFLKLVDLEDIHGKAISTYSGQVQYLKVMRECALFLLIRLLRKIFLENKVWMVKDIPIWRARLDHPF